jgi:cytochrome P450
VRSSYAVATRPLEFLAEMSKRYGDIVQFPLLTKDVILFNHPDAIEELVVTRKDILTKDWLTQELGIVIGQGLVLSEGPLWKQQRRLIQPGFHHKRIAAYADVMVAFTERQIEGWKNGETRDVHLELMRLTLDIVAKTLFGVDVGAASRRVEAALHVFADRFASVNSVIPLRIPTPSSIRTKRAIAEIDDVVYGIIRERRASGDSGDLISMLLAATDESDKMTDRQLRDEAVTLLLAGHETTAVALGWTLYLLAKHPLVAKKLHEEIETVLGDRPGTAADVPKLGYADAVIREAMRLVPPAWAIGREAQEEISVAGHSFKKGTQLWVAQWVVHHDARWFPEPELFKPERWQSGSIPKHAYLPFGGGPRVCIGNAFAMMEMILVLVTMARRFDFHKTRDVGIQASVTLRPKGGMQLRVTTRS